MTEAINIFCCSTKYHMLLSCLLAFQHRNERNVLVVEHSGFQGEESLIREYTPPLFNEVHLLYYPINEMPRKTDYLLYKRSVRKMIEGDCPALKAYRENNNGNIHCYLCEDGHHFARYFVYNFENVVMLEEGMQIYKPYARNESIIKQRIKYDILGIIRPNGRDKRIREIWVQHPDRLPADVADKGKLLEMKALLDEISQTDYLYTMESMLGFSDVILNDVKAAIQNKNGNKLILLVTQPLSEDGLVSYEAKKKIYSEVLSTIKGACKLIIKPHPRENTNYREWFENAIILDNSFPLEMIRFVCKRDEKPIDWALTIDSTAVMNIAEVCEHVKAFGLCDITVELSKKYPLGQGFEK